MFAMSAARSDCAHADRKGGFAELRERHIEKRKGYRPPLVLTVITNLCIFERPIRLGTETASVDRESRNHKNRGENRKHQCVH
jgi:hypothetical protein